MRILPSTAPALRPEHELVPRMFPTNGALRSLVPPMQSKAIFFLSVLVISIVIISSVLDYFERSRSGRSPGLGEDRFSIGSLSLRSTRRASIRRTSQPKPRPTTSLADPAAACWSLKLAEKLNNYLNI
jgi:hypothetical protein